MRNKLFSSLLCILMLSGLIVPLMMADTSDGMELTTPEKQMESSEIMNSWYHDGSNITGFTSPVASLPTMGSLNSSGTYFYSDDLGSSSGWHGPAMSYSLEEAFTVSQMTSFDIDVEFDCYSTTNRLGALNVILYDSDENAICR